MDLNFRTRALTKRAYRSIPRRHRYRVAQAHARLLEPTARPPPGTAFLDGYRERALQLACAPLVRHRIEFDFPIQVPRANLLPESGCIIASGHFYLNFFFRRWMFDRGRRIIAFARKTVPSTVAIVGRTAYVPVLHSGPASLLQMRDFVRDGATIVVALEGEGQRSGKRAGKWVDLPHRRLHVPSPLFQMADRFKVPLLFGATLLDPDRNVVTTLQEPTTRDWSSSMDEFCGFLRETAMSVATEPPRALGVHFAKLVLNRMVK